MLSFTHTKSQKVHRLQYDCLQGAKLCDAGVMNDWDFDFAVKIHFEGEGCSVKHHTAVIAAAQVALNFACDLRCESPF